MKVYTKAQLLKLYKQYDGHISNIAKSLHTGKFNIFKQYKKLGLGGRGCFIRARFSNEQLLELYKKYNGHIAEIARELKVSRQGVTERCLKLGLKGKGKPAKY